MKRAMMIACAAALASPGCEKSREPSGNGSGKPPVTLTVGHVGHDHQLALYVAALEGDRFLRDWGVGLRQVKPREVYDLVEDGKALARLRLLKVGGGSRMPAAMSRGEIDLGLGGTVPVAKFADGGQPFKIICPLQTDGDMLVMRKDSPIEDWGAFAAAAKSAGKPLRIGYKAPVAIAKMVFVGALKAEGIAFSYDAADPNAKVVLVNFGSEKSPIPLMETRAIDGFVMNQPAVAVAVNKGLGKVIAELRDLPPKGKWVHHPCCCIAATTDTIRKHGHALKALLKVILLSTQLIQADPALAIADASRWTKYDEAIERNSIPTITYVAEPTDTWIAGMQTWAEMVRDIQLFKGKYKDVSPEAFVADVCDLRLCRAAAAELRQKGLLK
jgi:NitT/TauT family transport system substrate-binding protein